MEDEKNPFLPFFTPLIEQNEKILASLAEIKKALQNTTENANAVVGRKELAQRLGITLPTIHALMRKGLPYYKVGRRTLFKLSQALEFLEKNHIKF
ncbi:MAG: helix-turn-helix domain-containing protein [Raineya sp.]|nr:helix-turn-helix domain-containing protein [Raineya sp.]MDW8297516.1 helix-turn-helix domain-containing protein [Raineya sp.]